MDSVSSPLRTTAIRLGGRDALALLHRVSTNALLDLAPGEARATLFCDFRGRLLHRAVVYRARDGALWLLRDDAPGSELAAFMDRFVFREDVTIEDRSETLFVTRDPAGPPGSDESGGVPIRVAIEGEALRIGSASPIEDARSRIEAGRPAHGHEIVEEFNPFEVGLGDEVHLDKGCYTGQEALQRLTTYGSVRRRLAKVAGLGAAPMVPTDLTLDGQPAGRLTSAVSVAGDRWTGLAVVIIERLDSGKSFTVAGQSLAGPPVALDSPRPLGRP